MNIKPIITSILDNDLYTATVGQVAFMHFPAVKVKYKFINRGKTKLPSNFYPELLVQLEHMRNLFLTDAEYAWLDSLGYLSYDYLTFLRNYRFNPDQLNIVMDDGNLDVEFEGTWEDLIMWEVPFLALFSELYYKITGAVKDDQWKNRIMDKAKLLSQNGVKWMEFGTRRRFDFETQDTVVAIQKNYNGFLGTSNMRLAMRHNVPVLGTMSHQGPMAMQAKYGATLANKEWRNVWLKTYKNKLLTFLPDTYTTDVFLRDFSRDEAVNWNLRQDSGDPDAWMAKILGCYAENGIHGKSKTAVLSDSLNPELAVGYHKKYNDIINMVFGIGTNLSNDCGHKQLSIVIKLSEADFGNGYVPVVKLSDTSGKHTGTPEAIAAVKKELNTIRKSKLTKIGSNNALHLKAIPKLERAIPIL
jgi:nicotinate phosphoribosyltransferase